MLDRTLKYIYKLPHPSKALSRRFCLSCISERVFIVILCSSQSHEGVSPQGGCVNQEETCREGGASASKQSQRNSCRTQRKPHQGQRKCCHCQGKPKSEPTSLTCTSVMMIRVISAVSLKSLKCFAKSMSVGGGGRVVIYENHHGLYAHIFIHGHTETYLLVVEI